MVSLAKHESRTPGNPPSFNDFWVAEAVRLRETQWGPYSDNTEIRRACAGATDFSGRLLYRAHDLGQREGLNPLVHRWSGLARLTLLILVIVAVLTGSGIAMGALGDGSHPVNLFMALVALLGLHALTFLFWAASLFLPAHGTQAGLGEFWLWVTRKLARGPHAALIPRALASLLSRRRALHPLLSAVSHGVWLCALASMTLTLAGLLSARRYTFQWETTLLSPDAFVGIASALGSIPSWLGFTVPSASVVRISDGLHTLPDLAHAQWSAWLIGVVVCWGLIPRALAWGATAALARRRLQQLSLDPTLPGYAELRDRLDPPSLPGHTDGPAPAHLDDYSYAQNPATRLTDGLAIVGVELPGSQPWPPMPLPDTVADLGVIDSREQRQRLLQTLQTRSPHKLVVACDAHQTPDRGTVLLLQELLGMAAHSHVILLSSAQSAQPDVTDRIQTWRQKLQQIGLEPLQIHQSAEAARAWLLSAPAQTTASSTTPS